MIEIFTGYLASLCAFSFLLISATGCNLHFNIISQLILDPYYCGANNVWHEWNKHCASRACVPPTNWLVREITVEKKMGDTFPSLHLISGSWLTGTILKENWKKEHPEMVFRQFASDSCELKSHIVLFFPHLPKPHPKSPTSCQPAYRHRARLSFRNPLRVQAWRSSNQCITAIVLICEMETWFIAHVGSFWSAVNQAVFSPRCLLFLYCQSMWQGGDGLLKHDPPPNINSNGSVMKTMCVWVCGCVCVHDQRVN